MEADSSLAKKNDVERHTAELRGASEIVSIYQTALEELRERLDDQQKEMDEISLSLEQVKKLSNIQGKYLNLFFDFVEDANGLSEKSYTRLHQIRDGYKREAAGLHSRPAA
jgi:hypothetical protein